MPVYLYKCSKCEHGFEALNAPGGKPPLCPKCAAKSYRLYTPINFAIN